MTARTTKRLWGGLSVICHVHWSLYCPSAPYLHVCLVRFCQCTIWAPESIITCRRLFDSQYRGSISTELNLNRSYALPEAKREFFTRSANSAQRTRRWDDRYLAPKYSWCHFPALSKLVALVLTCDYARCKSNRNRFCAYPCKASVISMAATTADERHLPSTPDFTQDNGAVFPGARSTWPRRQRVTELSRAFSITLRDPGLSRLRAVTSCVHSWNHARIDRIRSAVTGNSNPRLGNRARNWRDKKTTQPTIKCSDFLLSKRQLTSLPLFCQLAP